MKLKNKLFLNFAALFFLSINVFGFILIQSNFNIVMENTINNSLAEYSVIYANIKSGENLNNVFLSNKDIIKIKCDHYLKNTNNSNISLVFLTLDKERVYETSNNIIGYSEELFNISNGESSYEIITNNNEKLLLINNKIELNGDKYFFIYSNNLNTLYENKYDNILTLIKLNILVGVFLLGAIYFISVDITKNIDYLISSIDEIINGNYNKKITYSSDIKEFNAISNNFSVMNNEIQNNISKLEEQNNIKQRFINNLTHEIRTPLTSIIGYSKLMLDKKVDNPNIIQNAFENINREGNRILSLTSNLITLITLDKKSLNLKKESLISIIKEVQDRFQIKIKEKNIEFLVKGEDIEIITDRGLVNILISNFIDNSIKALNEKSEKKITLTIEDFSLKVEDNGKGISKEDLEKIFEPFYMVDQSRSKSIEGFGLGLSICREIVEMLDIGFDIKSTYNTGTEITLTFKKEVKP